MLMHNINEVALSPLSSSFNRGEPPSEVIIEGPKSIITGDENKEELQVQVCVVLYFVTATEAEFFSLFRHTESGLSGPVVPP